MSPSIAGPSDTDPAIRRMQIERWRAMTIEEKFAKITVLNEMVEAMAVAGIRSCHPQADADEVKMRLGVIRFGPDLMRRAFGWDVELHGH